ncbi:MAG: hypothetical protein ACOX19_05535 [Fermentimonas sp.]|jgi:hypothetical protein
MKFKLFILTLLALLVASCTSEDLPEPVEKEGKIVTINATIPTETRVTYNDGTRKLAWENGDRILLVGFNGQTYIGNSPFTWTGQGNQFTGEAVQGATTYKAYYPAETTILDGTGNVQLSGTFWQQKQNGNNSTAHLGKKLRLSDEDANSIDQTFYLVSKSNIIRFNLTIPNVGTPQKLIWTVEPTSGETRSTILDITDVSNGTTELTLFLAFDPDVMKIAAGGKVKISITGDNKSYEWTKTVTAGKTYADGNHRYYTTVNDGNWTEVVPFTYTIKTNQASTTHTIWHKGALPSSCCTNLTIYWGDGSENTFIPQGTPLTTSNLASNIYANAGDYTITIISEQTDYTSQQMPPITFCAEFTGNKHITAVLTPFPNMGTTIFRRCFYDCSNLTSIPAGLFDYNTQATDFGSCFESCSKLTSIPAGLFDYNTQATDFGSCFESCSRLTAIPAGLFSNNTQAGNFANCFQSCTQLATIPAGLFSNSTSATNFSYCFDGCSNLFLIQGIFPNPTGTGSQPNFFGNREMNFTGCFKGVGSSYATTTGAAPELWLFNNASNWSFSDCFLNATKLENYGSIPDNWKGL